MSSGSPSTVFGLNSGTRKKKITDRKTKNERNLKYVDKDPLALKFHSPCEHNSKRFKCACMTINDIIRNRKLLYTNEGKVQQDVYLSRFITASSPKRSKDRVEKRRLYSVAFFLWSTGKTLVPVCKKFFCHALSVTIKRVDGVAKLVFNGLVPTEKRGGDRKSHVSEDKKGSIRSFIGSLPAKESHYNRQKSKRVYLSHELNIKMLHKMHNKSTGIVVSETMFRRIFETEFNIGFSSPASDVCSTCTILGNKIKYQTNPEEIEEIKTGLKVHKLRANAFYDLTKEKPEGTLAFCFDMQQIQVLPKTPIQEAFYLRQIGLYVSCFVNMKSQDPDFYIWTENQASKGSVEVASALIHHLNTLDLTGIKTLRLYADGCGGQNKNSHIIHALIFWLFNSTSTTLKEIMLIFPVREHTFLPADRVFGRVEKELRKHTYILQKETYFEIYRKFGRVHVLSEDWVLYDIKDLTNVYKHLPGMRDLKRILIEKRSVEYEEKKKRRIKNRQPCVTVQKVAKYITCGIRSSKFYKDDINTQPAIVLLKNGQIHRTILKRKAMIHEMKTQKKRDVVKLLTKQFSETWSENPDLAWYREVLGDYSGEVDGDKSDDDENIEDCGEKCECVEIDVELNV